MVSKQRRRRDGLDESENGGHRPHCRGGGGNSVKKEVFVKVGGGNETVGRKLRAPALNFVGSALLREEETFREADARDCKSTSLSPNGSVCTSVGNRLPSLSKLNRKEEECRSDFIVSKGEPLALALAC